MAMSDRDRAQDAPLEEYFAAARAAPPETAPDFLARVSAEAEAFALQHGARARRADRDRPGLWQGLREALGGWPALTGLATAGLAGLWLGFAPPAGIAASLGDLWTGAGADVGTALYAGDIAFWLEEG